MNKPKKWTQNFRKIDQLTMFTNKERDFYTESGIYILYYLML